MWFDIAGRRRRPSTFTSLLHGFEHERGAAREVDLQVWVVPTAVAAPISSAQG